VKLLKLEYDRRANAAYIYVVYPIGVAQAVKQLIAGENEGEPPTFILDLDEDGLLLGIDVQNADRHLPQALLASAEIIG